ncbi:hypothetical protein ACFC26_43150 [Kitasatospora purpeofusca]|uniref:hypothetical protein n=1 Tax=Kitasatospora purpeofusca TaxID=67352 RepID=UPI0035E2FEC5
MEPPAPGGRTHARKSPGRATPQPAEIRTPAERAAAMAALEQKHRVALAAGRANRAERRAEQQAAARAARDLAAALRAAGITATPATAPSHPTKGQGRAVSSPDGGPGSNRESYVSAAGQSPFGGAADGGCGQLAKGADAQLHSMIKKGDARLRLLDGIQRITGLPTLEKCQVVPLGDAVGFHLHEGAGRRPTFSGLVRCGSVWACPPCAAAIRAKRAAELEVFALAWLEAGRGIYMATLTAPHWEHVRLLTQFGKFAEGWRGVGQGAWWTGRAVIRDKAPVPWHRRNDYDDLPEDIEPREVDGRLVVWKQGWKASRGIRGVTRTIEVTHGANGWHSHLHVLLWTEQPATREQADLLQEELYRRWAARCKAVGLPTPDREHGVRVDPAIRQADGSMPLGLVKYLAKVQDQDVITKDVTARPLAAEMTRSDDKLARGAKGRTPFKLAELAITGDEVALGLWREYETATKGRQCLTWTEGLKAELAALAGVDLDERDDEELPAAEDDEKHRDLPDLAVRGSVYRSGIALRPGGRADLTMAGHTGKLPGVLAQLLEWGLKPGTDFWKPEQPLGRDAAMTKEQVERRRRQKAERQAYHEQLRQQREGTPERWAAAKKKRAATIAARAAAEKAAAAQADVQQELIDHQALADTEQRQRAAAAERFRAARRAARGTDPTASDAIHRSLKDRGLIAV